MTMAGANVWPLAVRWWVLEVGRPEWLVALLLLIPIIYLWKTSRVRGSIVRRSISLGLRLAIVLSLILALAETRLVWKHRGICVVFLVDQSLSVPADARDPLRDALREQINKMTPDDQFAVIEFAGDAVLESLPGHRGELPPPVAAPDPERTDVARALRLAMASFPPGLQKRIVLMTDGNQNAGDALREARIAAANDVDINTVLLHGNAQHDVMIEQLVAPAHVQKDQRLALRAVISTDQPQHATLLVTRDNAPLPEHPQIEVDLKAGTNVFDIPDAVSTGGFHDYEVTVIPTGEDAFPQNNTAHAFTQVEAPGKVLVIEGHPEQHDYLADALQANRVNVEAGPPGRLPATEEGLMAYDAVVLEDVNRWKIDAQLPALERWVRDFGGGLVLVGGTDSFGPGGYKGTALERVSPVDMDVKKEKHLASLALVVVIDKSGSMAAPATGGPGNLKKMDLANQGAAETLKLLDSSDEAQVGAVDTMTAWMTDDKLVPMTPGNKREMIDNTLANRVGGGGIYCKTALVDAYDLITAPSVHAMSRHVIMFADAADSEQQEGCVDAARKMYETSQVTTTVIGLGNPRDPDVAFQKAVAAAGHGRAYLTDDAMALPRFFAKEAFIASRNAYVEKPEGIVPTLYQSPLLQGLIQTGVPRVYGYVGTTLKPRATLAAHGLEADDPLIAHWVVGLGKCVAYTSDATGRWDTDWVRWEGYSKFWTQTVRWVSRGVQNTGLSTTTTIEGGEGRVVVNAVDGSGKPINNLQLGGGVAPPDRTRSTVNTPLVQVAPGRYEGTFNVNQKGSYLVNVVDQKTNQPLDVSGAVMSYPVEFRDLNPNAALLRALADTTGGGFLNSLAEVFTPKEKAVFTYLLLWEPLLIFAAIALFLDIALRRLNFGEWFKRRRRPALVPAAAGATLGAFRRVKTGRQEVGKQRETLRDQIASNAQKMPELRPTPAGSPTPGVPTVAQAMAAAAEAAKPKAEPAPKEAGYASSLRSAKKRAADRIEEKRDG